MRHHIQATLLLALAMSFVAAAPASAWWCSCESPPAALLEVLAKFGLVTARGERVSAREPAGNVEQLLSFDAKDLPTERLAELLSRSLGREVTIDSAEPGQRITLQVQDAPAAKVLRVLAKMAEVTVDGEHILPQ
ncbi:MAG: hypothetical protein ACRDHY_15450 [Anaerolineales bacterium]